MTKIILMLLLFCTTGYLGINIGNVYKSKLNFYQDLISFCKFLKAEISFLKTDILTVLSKTNYNSKLNTILTDYKQLIEKQGIATNSELDNLLIKYDFLDTNDKKCINSILLNLGKLGYDEQLENIDYNIETCNNLYVEYNNKNSKLIPLYKKMGFLVGILVCIVLI